MREDTKYPIREGFKRHRICLTRNKAWTTWLYRDRIDNVDRAKRLVVMNYNRQ